MAVWSCPAVARKAAEDVARQAFRVDAHQHRLFLDGDFAVRAGHAYAAQRQGDLREGVDETLVHVDVEGGQRRRQPGLRDLADQPFLAVSELDDLGHGAHFQIVLFAEGDEVRQARHGAVGLHDLADDAGGLQAGQPRQVHGPLGLPGPHKDAALAGPDGEDVPRPREVLRLRALGDGHEDGPRPVGGADARRDAGTGIDRHGKGRAERGRVLRGLRRKLQALHVLMGQRQADEAAPVGRHEVDDLGGDFLGGADEVSLVLALLVVHQDDHAPRNEFREDFRYRTEWILHDRNMVAVRGR
jgi:hypothetical protein